VNKKSLPFSSISVLGTLVKVKMLGRLPGKWGEYEEAKSLITLLNGPKEKVERTLIHEVVHHWQYTCGRPLEEAEATALELFVWDFIKNNKAAVKWIMRQRW